MSGNQAMQTVQAGLKAIYCSGWQVAGDGNSAGEMYPDQSLYPVDSVPKMVERINNALLRTDQIHHMDGSSDHDWLVPIIADAEAGFGGNLNAFELTKALIARRRARRFTSRINCPRPRNAATWAARCWCRPTRPSTNWWRRAWPPTLPACRRWSSHAPTRMRRTCCSLNHDPRDARFLTGERSSEGFFHVRAGIEQAIDRGLSYAPYADLLWCETSKPDMAEARRFAAAIHAQFPGKLLAYNCSPSFNWQTKLDAATMKRWREDLAAMGYRFQFITLAGWHALNLSMFELASAYRADGMYGYSQLAATRIHPGERGLSRHQAPGLCRHRLFRCGTDGDQRRRVSRPAPWPAAPRTSSSRGHPRNRRSLSPGERAGHSAAPVARTGVALTSPQDAAALIVAHFRAYNEEFGRITRRAADISSVATALPGARCRRPHRALRAARRAALRALRTAGAGNPELAAPAVGLLGGRNRRLRSDDRAPPRQRLLPHLLQFGHPRPVWHRRRQPGRRVLRHPRRPRLRARCRSASTGSAARCRTAVREVLADLPFAAALDDS